jgi:hypothetical protein
MSGLQACPVHSGSVTPVISKRSEKPAKERIGIPMNLQPDHPHPTTPRPEDEEQILKKPANISQLQGFLGLMADN